MSDTICIMNEGRIVQMGGARELYDDPINRYVADFVGKSNFIAGTVVGVDQHGAALRDVQGLSFTGRRPGSGPDMVPGEKAVLAVRPESVSLIGHADGASAGTYDVAFEGRVRNRIFLGEQTEYLVAVEGIGGMLALVSKFAEEQRGVFGEGQAVRVAWNNRSALVLKDP